MALRLPIGDYVPGTTIVHRLDPRLKLLLLVVYAVCLFICRDWLALGLMAVVLVVLTRLAKLKLGSVARGLWPVLFILAFTFLANALSFVPAPGATDTLRFLGWQTQLPQTLPIIGVFSFRPLGALNGLYFCARIVLLVVATSLLTLTTSVVALTDALAKLLRPLTKLKVPVQDIAMIVQVAMRFIPITFDEVQKLVYAQSARGATFSTGGPIKRVKAYLPVLLPLLVNLFKKADDLAYAMEARCYRGTGRTALDDSHLHPRQLAWALSGSAVFILVAVFL
jgi:energy-coupling factor transport system permease protein